MKKWIFVVLMLSLCLLAGIVSAWPTPNAVSKSGDWTLGIRYEHPQQITVHLPGWEQPRRFWYMIFSLTNEELEHEISLYPKCELVTDTFNVFPCGKGVNQKIFQMIKGKHQGSYPFLESLDFEDHQIRKGKDNTRDFVIFWPDFDSGARQVKFYVGGLSNETIAIAHPMRKDSAGNPELVYLQKTLELTYTIGADPKLRQNASLKFDQQQWVMR